MTEESIVLQLTTIEVSQLTALVHQFADLVSESDPGDPGLARIAPDAYPDDPEAADEFRRLTRDDLFSRRADDAGTVLRTLDPEGDVPDLADIDDSTAVLARLVALDGEESGAWMRTLAALRLVLAERIGIQHEDDRDVDDPRFMLYEWIGMILDALVRAQEP